MKASINIHIIAYLCYLSSTVRATVHNVLTHEAQESLDLVTQGKCTDSTLE